MEIWEISSYYRRCVYWGNNNSGYSSGIFGLLDFSSFEENMNSPAIIWRTERVRLRGFTTRPCCEAVEVRKTPEFTSCVGCGTHRTWTPDGLPVTLFGEKYLEIARSKQPIPVDLRVRVKQNA